MRIRASWKQNPNTTRAVTKLVILILIIFIGGALISGIGEVIIGTESPFYGGFRLLGFTVGYYPQIPGTTDYYGNCAATASASPNHIENNLSFSSQSSDTTAGSCQTVTSFTTYGASNP